MSKPEQKERSFGVQRNGIIFMEIKAINWKSKLWNSIFRDFESFDNKKLFKAKTIRQMRLIYYYNVSVTLYARVLESFCGWINSFPQRIINSLEHRRKASCVFISEDVLCNVWCIGMVFIVWSFLNDLPSRIKVYFYDSALL